MSYVKEKPRKINGEEEQSKTLAMDEEEEEKPSNGRGGRSMEQNPKLSNGQRGRAKKNPSNGAKKNPAMHALSQRLWCQHVLIVPFVRECQSLI